MRFLACIAAGLIIGFFMGWLTIGFCEFNWDVSRWTADSRFFLVCIAFGSSVAIGGMIDMEMGG